MADKKNPNQADTGEKTYIKTLTMISVRDGAVITNQGNICKGGKMGKAMMSSSNKAHIR